MEVIERARRDAVMIYTIGMRSRGAQRMPPPRARRAAARCSPKTCRIRALRAWRRKPAEARPRSASDRISPPHFARVADELHSQYLIGYALPKRDGKTHDLDVRLTQRGLTARARKSYVAPKG